MNSTLEFEQFKLTTPLENRMKLRCNAVLRLCVVGGSFLICFAELVGIEVWTFSQSSLIVVLGLWIGIGTNAEFYEPFWRKFGPLGQLAILVSLLMIGAGLLFSEGHIFWRKVSAFSTLMVLAWIAWYLMQMMWEPMHAARYRQLQRYLRTLPRRERSEARKHLMANFARLVSEGFR